MHLIFLTIPFLLPFHLLSPLSSSSPSPPFRQSPFIHHLLPFLPSSLLPAPLLPFHPISSPSHLLSSPFVFPIPSVLIHRLPSPLHPILSSLPSFSSASPSLYILLSFLRLISVCFLIFTILSVVFYPHVPPRPRPFRNLYLRCVNGQPRR